LLPSFDFKALHRTWRLSMTISSLPILQTYYSVYARKIIEVLLEGRVSGQSVGGGAPGSSIETGAADSGAGSILWSKIGRD